MEVEGGAGAFGGDHGRTEGGIRSATRPEVGAGGGCEETAEDLGGGAGGGVVGGWREGGGWEKGVGIEGGVGGGEGEAALGEGAEAAPDLVAGDEDFVHEGLSGGVAFGADGGGIGVEAGRGVFGVEAEGVGTKSQT